MTRKALAQIVFVLASAGAMKLFYSNASVNDLRWILFPTTYLVEAVTGRSFEFESYSGYVSEDRTFVIAASCAGVNFLITAFLLLSLSEVLKRRDKAWSFFPAAALIAFAATIVANSMRIATALWLRETNTGSGWLTQDEIHRLDGIVIYFGVLLLLYFANEVRDTRRMTFHPRLLFPVAIYYATTLGIPIATGAYSRLNDFGEHALFVLVVPPVLIAVTWMICNAVERTAAIIKSGPTYPDLT